MNTIPIYNAVLNSDFDGITAVSICDDPATEVPLQYFSKEEKDKLFKFEVTDELEHCFTAPLMIADTPIYRYSAEMGEYYIKFEKETLKDLAVNMLAKGTQNICDVNHNFEYFYDKLQMRECFIKDVAKGINPVGFENEPDGSLFATYKCDSIELWEKILSGELNGISIEAYFDLKIENMSKQTNDEQEVLDLINKIKNKLK